MSLPDVTFDATGQWVVLTTNGEHTMTSDEARFLADLISSTADAVDSGEAAAAVEDDRQLDVLRGK